MTRVNDDAPAAVAVSGLDRRHVLRAAAGQFEAAGFPDEFRRVRAAVNEIDALEDEAAGHRHAVEQLEGDLGRRLAAGTVTLADAAAELARAAPGGLDPLVERTLRQMRRQLTSAAVAEATAAVARLVPLVNAAAAEAVEAGRACVDVAAVVRSFRGANWRYEMPVMAAQAEHAAEWPTAVAATEKVADLRRLVDVAVKAGGPQVAFWGRRAIGETGWVAEAIPAPLQLAVGAGLGWAPELRVAGGPAMPSGDEGARAAEQAAIAQAPATGAVHRRMVDALTGRA